MSTLDKLTIGEVKELSKMFSASTSDDFSPAKDGELVIVVLQRGWVMVGEYSQIGNTGRLDNAKVIRVWGTSKGLGELAEKGPLSGTKLDDCMPVKFHVREMVFIMEVNKAAWRK